MLKSNWNVILSLPNGLTPGGMTTWAVQTANALSRRGRRVIIVSHDMPASIRTFDTTALNLHDNVRVLHQPALTNSADWERLLAAYRRMLPAVMIPSTIEQSFEIAAALAMITPSQSRIVGWSHSDHEYDYACLTHIEPICETFVANTTACRRSLEDRMPLRRSDITTLSHWVEIPTATPPRHDPTAPIRVGYAGRLEESAKRIGDLIETAVLLRERNVPFQLEIVGDGPARARIAERITHLQLTPSGPAATRSNTGIRLRSPLPPDRMAEFWQSRDCLLLPSAYEGLNLQMIEAMANGCVPVVTNIASGPADFIEHAVNGLTFEVGDCAAAAENIARLASDIILRNHLADRARETIRARCEPNANVSRLDALIDSAIEAAPRAWPRSTPIALRGQSVGIKRDADEAIDRMRQALADAARRGQRAIAIYGAGRHTKMLAAALVDAPVTIRAFIDDDDGPPNRTLWNWPIVTRETALRMNLDAVIVSSRMNERQILTHGSRFADAGIELIPLYASHSDVDRGVEHSAGPLTAPTAPPRSAPAMIGVSHA